MPPSEILMVLGGEPPTEEILNWYMEESDLTIAVDKGWLAFRNAGVLPHILIGDMDSWEGVKADVPNNVELIEDNDQNSSDFQKALRLMESRVKAKKLVVLGGFGNRTDHLLGNLIHMCTITQPIEVILDSSKEWICRVTVDTPLIIKGQEGATISLLTGDSCQGVSSQGLKWEINDEKFSFVGKLSQSNLCISNEVKISVQSGNLLVFLQK